MNMSALTTWTSCVDILELLALVSVATFLISIVCIPLLVARLPRNYFLREKKRYPNSHPPIRRIAVLVARNVIGSVIFIAGIAMLFLPGQGIITMVIGLAVMSFPYKKKMLLRLTRPPSIQHSLDWLRTKMEKEPFQWP